MKTLEESFTTFLGRPPTDSERQVFLREREALNLKDNDAFWRLLMVLGHYETLYGRFPGGRGSDGKRQPAAPALVAGLRQPSEYEKNTGSSGSVTKLSTEADQSKFRPRPPAGPD